ncbi:hypothetical protein CIB48_g10069 [Xylaria polymorpha]|nr:hypothetical protein CIB48_g10069 [Xylaria polymorpha]
MELNGAPPSSIPIPDGEIPVLASTVRALSSAKFEVGDIQMSWHNIGLASTVQDWNAPKPTEEQIDDYIRRLAAIRVLREFKNSRWDWNGVINIDLQEDYSTRRGPWARVPGPDPWHIMEQRIPAHIAGLQYYIDTFEPVGFLHLTRRERRTNWEEKNSQLLRYWDAAPQTGGFFSRNGDGSQNTLHLMNWPEDGNSLCYVDSLSQEWTRHWAFSKVDIWKYFNYVIHHPSHVRHRLYVHLERQSWTEIEQHTPGSERLWGRMSILRALHLNTPNSGPPGYGHFQGMMQVIADYYCKEVILFIRRPDSTLDLVKPEYDYRGQYQVVTHRDNVLLDYSTRGPDDPPKPGPMDTSHRSADDRYGWINAPWMPPRPLPAAYKPAPLTIQAIEDAPDFVRPSRIERWQFAGCGEALDDDNRYGRGWVPILPGWLTETTPPLPGPDPYPEFPYGFGNRLIVTGVYEDANGREWWPQWNNILAYQAYQFRQLAIERDLPTTPHKLSQP